MSSDTDRGYGWKHAKARAAWKPMVDRGEVCCARCGRLIQPGQLWDLDHTADRQGYLGPSHRRCNRAAGARNATKVRSARAAARRAMYQRW